MNNERTPKELIEELYGLFSSFKQKMEDPNFIQIENTLTQLLESQGDMKKEIRELKKQLLNPFDGVIVETKKNTEFRKEIEQVRISNEKLIDEHKELMRFKAGFVRLGWIILTGIGGVITFLLTQALNIFGK